MPDAVASWCREVGLLKINVERAEWDVLAGVADEDWPKVQRRSHMRNSVCIRMCVRQRDMVSVSCPMQFGLRKDPGTTDQRPDGLSWYRWGDHSVADSCCNMSSFAAALLVGKQQYC